MKNAVILHGKPKRERYFDPAQPKPHEANWLPWLADQLEQRAIETAIPAFPEPYAPKYDAWAETFERYQITDATGVVGHSAGAGFILRWLSENSDVHIERLVMVAPWHDKNHEYGREFFDYEIDPFIAERVGYLSLFHSLDDSDTIHESVAMIRDALPGIHYREFENHGHFMYLNNMSSLEFPELLEELKRE